WPILIEMIERRLAGQRSILPEPEELQGLADSVYERILRKGRLKAKRTEEAEEVRTNLSEITVTEPLSVGPLNVGKAFWDRLGMGQILKDCGMSKTDIGRCMVEVLGR
ncbi:MAG: hypothetical protein ACK4Z9_07720, partial [Thermodesulfovibrionales bacterium]